MSNVPNNLEEAHVPWIGDISVCHQEANEMCYLGLIEDHHGTLNLALSKGSGDIEPGFLGFMGTYKRLAELIPLDWDVYDLGCAYGFQSWFFKHHKRYIGVDYSLPVTFNYSNATWIQMDIHEYVKELSPGKKSFAILNCVPNVNPRVVSQVFPFSYTYYPQGAGLLNMGCE